MNSHLTQEILAYMADESRYAIALEGDWGLGKTRYCEGELCEALAREKYGYVRISLFGVAGADEIYERMAAALVRLASGEDDGKAAKVAKDLGRTAISVGAAFVDNKLKKLGIELSATPRMVSCLYGQGQLVVFDDIERRIASDRCDRELFGVMNDLVEGQGCKVLLVTNSLDGKAIPKDVLEKLVWRRHRFIADPAGLATDILSFGPESCPEDIDTNECARAAARRAQCSNARAMIKVRPLMSLCLGTRTLADRGLDAGNRASALTDFACYALQAAGGKPPEPHVHGRESDLDLDRLDESVDYENYSKLPVIERYLRGETIKQADVDESMRQYMLHRYPESQETMELLRVTGRFESLGRMDDDEASVLASDFACCIRKAEFGIDHLQMAIQRNAVLHELGFRESLSDEEMLCVAKRMADADVERAYEVIHKEYQMWGDMPSASASAVMDELDRYIVESYERGVVRRKVANIRLTDAGSGTRLADFIEGEWREGSDPFLHVMPEALATSFANSDGESQYRLYQTMKNIKNHTPIHRSYGSELSWVAGLRDSFSALEIDSRLGRLRLSWVMEEIEELASRVEQLAQ